MLRIKSLLNYLSVTLTLHHFRERLAHMDALPQLALLGLMSGILTGGLMVLFINGLNLITHLLFDLPPEVYDQLSASYRIAMPMIGCLLLALLYHSMPKHWHACGIGHVIERFTLNQGHMPAANALNQLLSALITLGCGLSAGREGPAVHMGASISSLLGVSLKLPNNSIRILVGCGSAAAIGASFNTPIAGVIFAMEVIMAEYTLVGFTPVILASVSGTAISQWLLGDTQIFSLLPGALYTLSELPWVAASGVLAGVMAALFIHITGWLYPMHRFPVFVRFMLAGSLTALTVVLIPPLMGSGFSLMDAEQLQETAMFMLLILALCKLLLTAVTFGLGVPIGIIGPVMVSGGLLGAVMGHLGADLAAEQVSDISVYTMLGMASLMAATLQAPLAALMALLELTANPHIIMPGMLAVVAATLTSRYLLPENPSIFQHLLALKGVHLHHQNYSQVLNHTGVSAVMNQDFLISPALLTTTEARALLNAHPRWLLLTPTDSSNFTLLPAADLASFLEQPADSNTENSAAENSSRQISMSELPSENRVSVSPIPQSATLAEALQAISDMRTDALCVCAPNGVIRGIVTAEMIERFYR